MWQGGGFNKLTTNSLEDTKRVSVLYPGNATGLLPSMVSDDTMYGPERLSSFEATMEAHEKQHRYSILRA